MKRFSITFKIFVVTLFALISTVQIVAYGACPQNGRLLYEDLDFCEPVDNTTTCPEAYNCRYNHSGCVYKGKRFWYGEMIDRNLTNAACCTNCFCSYPYHISCQTQTCPENTFCGRLIDPRCYYGYSLGKCCSTGLICPRANETTCNVDGKVYKLGEKFTPKDTCLSCVCHENFTGVFDNTTCQNQTCNSQIRFMDEVLQNCAPVYFTSNSTTLCCPNQFVCPSFFDNIKVLNDTVTGSQECVYGYRKVKMGEGFYRTLVANYFTNRQIKCECVLPPLLTCTEV